MGIARSTLGGIALTFLLIAATDGRAQTPPARSEFEVASMKPNESGRPGFGISVLPGGGLRAANIHLKRLIAVAYAVTDYQIAGNVSWLESQRYDLDAKSPGPAALPQLRLMLQSLLEDRFKLKIHHEQREMAVFSLSMAKSGAMGPGLMEATEGDCSAAVSPQAPLPNGTPCGVANIGRGWIRTNRARISQVADRLSSLLGRTVVDHTGLTGLYNITLTWAPDPDLEGPSPGGQSSPDVSNASLFTAIRTQLGLKLESAKEPVDIVVIDSAEKASAN
ncbi:MAG TPA: TIGR03435 family protein [Bryobacteraceae bacterium]|nr:TIGR03435 family protein [Bryobacteraceae bacterium]